MKRFERDGRFEYVEEGFSWFCFFFSSLWALWRGNWTVLWAYLGLYALSFGAGFASVMVGHDVTGATMFAGVVYHVVVSSLANGWLEGELLDRGWKLSGWIE